MTQHAGPATDPPTARLADVVLVPYLRVSTRDQLDGYGLDTQEKQARAFSRRHGARLIDPCVDEALTGTDTFDREGLSCALAAIQEGRVDGMLVPSLSRLARRLDVQEAVLALVWRHGGRVFTVEDDGAEVRQDDPDDPMRTFVRQVMGAVHQLDAATVAKRLRDGRKAKADSGGYAGGAPAYGYRAEGRALVPDQAESAILARMRQWEGKGLSRRAIAERLNAEGAPTKRGGSWHPTTVSRALSEAARDADRQTAARQRAWKAEEKARRQTERAAMVAGVQR